MNTDLELLEEIKQAVRNIRVLRYTSSDEELKGFRVHLFEEEWDKLQKLLGLSLINTIKEVTGD